MIQLLLNKTTPHFQLLPMSKVDHAFMRCRLDSNQKVISERAVNGAPSQIPTLKFLTPPAPRTPTPGHDLGNRIKILFNMFSIFYL